MAVVILTLPTLFVSASPAGARAADARQGRASLPQRLGLDIALVAIAVVALAQLRLYGAPLTVNARGALGLDPLLVAAPAIGLIAGAVVALRVVPRIAEVLERFLVRGHGLVGALGGRQLARRPLRYSRAALLLILATALGTLTASHAATWIRSQQDQAAWQAAADVRAVAGDYPKLPSWAAGPTYRAIPGVAAATPVATVSFDLGRTIRSRDARRGRSRGTGRRRGRLLRRLRGRSDERRAGGAGLGRRRGARGADPGRHEASRDRRLRPVRDGDDGPVDRREQGHRPAAAGMRPA